MQQAVQTQGSAPSLVDALRQMAADKNLHPAFRDGISGLATGLANAIHNDNILGALCANESIQAEARAVYGAGITDFQCVMRVLQARWPSLPHREAMRAALAHYEIEVAA